MRSQSACDKRAPLSAGGVMNSTALPALLATDCNAAPKPAMNCLETKAVVMRLIFRKIAAAARQALPAECAE